MGTAAGAASEAGRRLFERSTNRQHHVGRRRTMCEARAMADALADYSGPFEPGFDFGRLSRAALARLGREAPIAMANPAGAALRDSQYSSASAGKLYHDVRNTRPERLPRSPVIGADAPVQYEQRDDIGQPRKRLPAKPATHES